MAVTTVNLSDQMAVFVQKTNIISGDLGDVAALTTSADSNAVVAINEIESNHNSLASTVSTIQTNLNNLDSDVGTRTSLVTNDRTDLVTAINEVKADANGISSGLGSYLRSDEADTKTVGDLNFVDNVKATFGTDSDMSVFHDGSEGFIRSDVLNIQNAAGSTDYVHIDDSGNVGIIQDVNIGNNDTSNPFSKLRFGASQYGAADIVPTDEGAHKVGLSFLTDGTGDVTINPIERMRIDGNGNVGLGTSSPVVQMHVKGSISANNAELRLEEVNGDVAQLISLGDEFRIGTVAANPVTFRTGNTERMRIDNNGNVGIGYTSPASKLNVNGTAYFNKTSSGDFTTGFEWQGNNGALVLYRNAGVTLLVGRSNDGEAIRFNHGTSGVGSITVSGGGTSYNTSSDERLKENIETLQNGTELLKAMRAVTYDWKADGNSDTGFIAQEMNEVMPQAVSEGDDGMLSMDYGRVTPIIVAALQDALKRIDELEAKQCNCGGCS